MKITLTNFRGSSFCRYRLYECNDAFPAFSGVLESGNIYYFFSDFCCGSWAAVNCIGGNGMVDDFSKIEIDNNPSNTKDRLLLSAWVAEKTNKKFGISFHKTARKLIADGLKRSNTHISLDDVIDLFSISEGRIDRPVSQWSGEIFNITMAIGFARGKKIYCFPWISEFEMNRIEGCWEQIQTLKRKDSIILIPAAENNFLKSHCDGIIKIKKTGVEFDV